MGRGTARSYRDFQGKHAVTYDLKAVRLPVLGPAGIRAVNTLAGLTGIGPLLIKKLRNDAGLSALTTTALDDPQTNTPMLSDVAPTILTLMGIPVPKAMTGTPLLT